MAISSHARDYDINLGEPWGFVLVERTVSCKTNETASDLNVVVATSKPQNRFRMLGLK